MARHPFGGGIGDWVYERNDSNAPVLAGGAVLTFWNLRVGGTQYTDLTQDLEGLTPAGTLLSSDGTDGYEVGDIPEFYGPPDQTLMWVSADGGPRHAIASQDAAALAGEAILSLAQHLSQTNPHGTSMSTLTDTAFPGTPTDGSFIAWDAGSSRFILVAGTGLNPADFVGTAGGSTIRIPDGNVLTQALKVRVPAGDRASAPDTVSVEYNTGSNGSPTWYQAFWLDAYGQLRCSATSDSRVAFKAQRKSSGSTADIAQWTNESGTPLGWVTANGSGRFPNVGRSLSFTRAGTVTTGVGRFAWVNATGVPVVLRALWFRLDTSGTGTSTFDINMDGTTLYPSGKPTIASGQNTSGIITAAFTIPAGSVITVDVDAIGTGAADLSAQLEIV